MGLMNFLKRIEILIRVGVKDALTVEEAAVWLGISESRVRQLLSAREIPYYKPTPNKTYIRKSELEAMRLQNRVPTNDEITTQAATYVATNRK